MSRRCDEYKVLASHDATGLAVLTNQWVHTGWEPVGGVAVEVDLDGAGSMFYQAVARYTERPSFVDTRQFME